MSTVSLHQKRTHPTPVEGCFGCKVSTLMYSPAIVESIVSGSPYRAQRRINTTIQRDGEAYWRLRREGLQPPHIRGSALLERHADSRYEIERGKIYRGEAGKALKEVMSMLSDAGFDPGKPVTAPKPAEGD